MVAETRPIPPTIAERLLKTNFDFSLAFQQESIFDRPDLLVKAQKGEVFNAGALMLPDGRKLLVARVLDSRHTPVDGLPDATRMAVIIEQENKLKVIGELKLKERDREKYRVLNPLLLEDARLHLLEDGRIEACVTVPCFENGKVVPKVGIKRFNLSDKDQVIDNEELIVFDEIKGKNFTHAYGNTYFLREEDKSHALSFYKLTDKDGVPKLEKGWELVFPDNFKYLDCKIGSVTEGIIGLIDGAVVLPIHSIHKLEDQELIDAKGEGYYQYAETFCVVSEDYTQLFYVPSEPYLTRQILYPRYPSSVDHNPKARAAIYCCGTVKEIEGLRSYINVGDALTYFHYDSYDKIVGFLTEGLSPKVVFDYASRKNGNFRNGHNGTHYGNGFNDLFLFREMITRGGLVDKTDLYPTSSVRSKEKKVDESTGRAFFVKVNTLPK